MRAIYVAGPYTADTYTGIDVNIQLAEFASVELIRNGWAVLTPHKNTSHYEKYENDQITYETWIAIDMELLKRCDAVFMLRKWKDSPGAIAEHAIAIHKRMRVFYESDGYPKEEEYDNHRI